MTDTLEELQQIAHDLELLVAHGRQDEIQQPLERLDKAVRDVEKAWSGSWLGYHANVYYKGLQPSPPGAHFSKEWGFESLFAPGTTGEWIEYASENVKAWIYQLAGNPDFTPAETFNDKASGEFETHKLALLSIIDLELSKSSSPFLSGLKDQVDKLSLVTDSEFVLHWMPKETRSADSLAVSQGIRTPPHYVAGAKITAIRHTLDAITDLQKLTNHIARHLLRQRSHQQAEQTTGGRVFIGHGHSPIWRELKDFLEDRLQLPVDEFNRIPTAGFHTADRLSSMLDAAAFAFLVMTGEDESAEGDLRARMNVVHEAGLFQGRLSFERAIVLLEEDCEEFSNIAGLGQIPFPRNNISAAFEEIRRVLEREGVLSE